MCMHVESHLEVGDCVSVATAAGVPPPIESSEPNPTSDPPRGSLTTSLTTPLCAPALPVCSSSTGLWLGLLISSIDVLSVDHCSTGLWFGDMVSSFRTFRLLELTTLISSGNKTQVLKGVQDDVCLNR